MRADGLSRRRAAEGVAVGRLPAQCTHAEAHQFCLAHLIRDAQYAIDHGDTIFAPQFKAFLESDVAMLAAFRRGLNEAGYDGT